MRKLAARYADTWSFTGSLYPFSNDALQYIRRMNSSMDEFCEQIGRDPASLRRSILHFNPELDSYFPFDSAESFRDTVESVLDAGINEIILAYPDDRKQLPLFEQFATEIIPKFRAKEM